MVNRITTILIAVILSVGYAAPYFSVIEKERAIAVQEQITKVEFEKLKWERERPQKSNKQKIIEQMIQYNLQTMGTKFTGEDMKNAAEALGEK